MNSPDSDSGNPQPLRSAGLSLIRLVGRGSYGEVWLAQLADRTYCAVKIVRRQSFEDDRPYEREFLGIEKFAPISRSYDSQLRILEVGRDNGEGLFYYTMELADDEHTGREILPDQYSPRTLRSELARRKRLPWKECVEIGMSLSAALENLHQNGLIHRDVKPSNIVFVDGAAKLADIGLVTDSDVSVSFVGTEGFIPPEGPGTPQADIYSLGKVLYEISTGRDRQSFPELPSSVAQSPEAKRFLELNAIVAKCCNPDPHRRYASARQLYADLALLHRGGSVRMKRSLRRSMAVAFASVAAVLVCFGLALLYLKFSAPPETRVIFQKAKTEQPQPTAATPAPVPEELLTLSTVPEENPSSALRQLDLAPFYNAKLDSPWHTPKGDARLNLSKFPAGNVQFGKVTFAAQGIVQLSNPETQLRGLSFPKEVTGIRAGQKATRLHFLHAAVWPARDGAQIGEYIIHYADRQQHVFPIIYGVDVRDWNIGSDPKPQTGRGAVVWAARQDPYAFRLFKSTWTNPLPNVQITSLDFISAMSNSAPFLIAITLE